MDRHSVKVRRQLPRDPSCTRQAGSLLRVQKSAELGQTERQIWP